MKRNILKVTAVLFAFALTGALACGGGGSSGGCGGSTPYSGAGSQGALPCGRGTHQEGGQCVANTNPTANGSGSNGTTSSNGTTQAPPISNH